MGDCLRCGLASGEYPAVCLMCIQKTDGPIRAEGAAAERARIVAWLRKPDDDNDDTAGVWRAAMINCAKCIERGEHVADAKESP